MLACLVTSWYNGRDAVQKELQMKRWSLVLGLLLVLAAVAPAQEGWISLFNGKDLTGWRVNENPATFKVEDGAIVASGPRSHLFYAGDVANHNFTNFELKVDVMSAPSANGGIFFHTEFQESGWPGKGFEVQVNNSHRDPIKSGSLYHVQDIGIDVTGPLVKDDEWFTEHIIVQGNNVRILLNDKEVVNWTQPGDWAGSSDFAGRRIGSGTIAFQGHDPGSTTRYKNILIKPLP